VFFLQSAGRPLARLSIAIPASIVSDTPHLREKTAKLGAIARAASIFGVNEIILYRDAADGQEADMEFCSEILRYIETPQYLRKKLFKLTPTLRYTGILPPLQAPHHNVPRSVSEVKLGDLREGVVVSRTHEDAIVDAGLEKPIPATGKQRLGERVTLRLTSVGRNLRGELVEVNETGIQSDKAPVFWGYKIRRARSLRAAMNESWGLRIGTSRYGRVIQEILPILSRELGTAQSVVIAFGAPKMGLREILALEKLEPKDVFDHLVNTLPGQETATVRAEEAIFVSLGLLNVARLIDPTLIREKWLREGVPASDGEEGNSQ